MRSSISSSSTSDEAVFISTTDTTRTRPSLLDVSKTGVKKSTGSFYRHWIQRAAWHSSYWEGGAHRPEFVCG